MNLPSTATCTACGMPLAYDRYVSENVQGDAASGLCSYCSDPRRQGRAPRGSENKDNTWVLKQIVDVYNSGGTIRRSIARHMTSVAPLSSTKLFGLAEVINRVPRKSAATKYDAIILYSGGKDSTYMLQALAKMDLRLCAWMLNQGYQSPQAIDNAKRMCDRLGVDLVIEKPSKERMDELFRLGFSIRATDDPILVRSVMTYGSACWPCFATIAAHATAFCVQHDVPFCFIGTQAGQNRLDLHGQPVLAGRGLPEINFLVEKFMRPFRDLAHSERPEAAEMLNAANCRTVLIPFYELVKKPEIDEQLATLEALGWTPPTNTGGCSTNCMINELGRKVMRHRFGFDLYQVIDAHERRIGNLRNQTGDQLKPPSLDDAAVARGARMIKLTPIETVEYGIEQ